MRGNLSDDQQRGRIEKRFMTYEKEIDEAEEMTKKVFVVIIAGFVLFMVAAVLIGFCGIYFKYPSCYLMKTRMLPRKNHETYALSGKRDPSAHISF